MPERTTHQLDGLIVVDKPAGMTSRRLVDVVGRALGTKSVGHAGTLDPLARGVMLLCVGAVTRLVELLHELPKRYEATFLLGRSSASDDMETPVEEEAQPMQPSRAAVEAALPAFRGDILQRPCDYSAAHVAGKRAYALARAGKAVALAPKPVHIDRLVVTDYDWPRLDLDIVCSSGTFIRALGRDLAIALGTRAVMSALRRTAVGPFTLADAVPLERIEAGMVRESLRLPVDAVPQLERVVLDGVVLDQAIRGAFVSPADLASRGLPRAADVGASPAENVAALDPAGDLVGILRLHPSGSYRLRPNFRGLG
jgi:tRNA pseudouridine55 synthase